MDLMTYAIGAFVTSVIFVFDVGFTNASGEFWLILLLTLLVSMLWPIALPFFFYKVVLEIGIRFSK